MKSRSLVPILTLIVSAACIGHQPYRTAQAELPPIERAEAGYKLGFIEFKDNGDFWDEGQLDGVLELIDAEHRAAPNGRIITLL